MMAFLMIVCVKLLLLMLLALDCSFAYNFQSGSNGQVMWASGCDFIGKYIGNQAGLGEICGDLCIANPSCTHFSWSNNVCYMKQAATKPPPSASNGVCGWVNNRNAYNFQSGSNGKVMWASGCDFVGNDIGKQAILAQNCGDACVANGQCTHFSWSNGGCYLKKAVDPSATNCNGGCICGYATQGIYHHILKIK